MVKRENWKQIGLEKNLLCENWWKSKELSSVKFSCTWKSRMIPRGYFWLEVFLLFLPSLSCPRSSVNEPFLTLGKVENGFEKCSKQFNVVKTNGLLSIIRHSLLKYSRTSIYRKSEYRKTSIYRIFWCDRNWILLSEFEYEYRKTSIYRKKVCWPRFPIYRGPTVLWSPT